MSWMLLWKVMLIAGLAGFALLAVVVTIGGARDIKTLIGRLDAPQEPDEPC